MSQQPWLRGVVKEVLSGDTLVILGASKPGTIPPEKRLTLACLAAPRLGRRDGATSDEPHAWASREYLRKLVVGKPVVFRTEYAVEAAGNREFGAVFVNERENVGLAVVSAGWARVRGGPSGQQSSQLEDLEKASAEAEAKGLGLWGSAPSAARPSGEEADAEGLLARLGAGSTHRCVVEAAMTGSMLRVTLLPDLTSAAVMVAGVQCPSLGKKKDAAEAPDAEDAAPSAAAKAAAGAPEPGAREAKFSVERSLLQRETNLTLLGRSQFGLLVASVEVPSPQDAAPKSLSCELARTGLARVVDWSAQMLPAAQAYALKEAERAARSSRLGIWTSYVPPASNSAALKDAFRGRVVEVVSGECVVVKDAASGLERRVNLSSVRAPRPGTRDRAPEAWAPEGREFLRSRLVGREVGASLEYSRKVGGAGAAGGGPERTMSFGTVTFPGKDGAELNAAEELLRQGLGQLARHRQDEERSAHFEALMQAEEAAKAAKKGLWSGKDPAPSRCNDLTLAGDAAKSKTHLPFLQRAGRVSGVVEAILAPHKLKISVPKQGLLLAACPSGVRCPQRAMAAGGGRPAQAEEPCAAEALAFVREAALQRQVELELDGVDRAGTFVGRVTVVEGGRRLDLGFELLQRGLGRLHAGAQAPHALLQAQERAQSAKKGLWAHARPEDAGAAGAAAVEEGPAPHLGERQRVVVADMRDGASMSLQIGAERQLDWVAEQLAAASLDDEPGPGRILRVGEACLARYALDGAWYRARVERAVTTDPTQPAYDVVFLDYGNSERVRGKDVREARAELRAVEALARPAALSGVSAPALDRELGPEAAQRLAEMVGGGRVLGGVVDGWGAAPTGKGAARSLMVTLFREPEERDLAKSVNVTLVKEGWARLEARACPSAPLLAALEEAQEQARRAHRGMWRYGDPGSDDEPEVPAKGWGRR